MDIAEAIRGRNFDEEIFIHFIVGPVDESDASIRVNFKVVWRWQAVSLNDLG